MSTKFCRRCHWKNILFAHVLCDTKRMCNRHIVMYLAGLSTEKKKLNHWHVAGLDWLISKDARRAYLVQNAMQLPRYPSWKGFWNLVEDGQKCGRDLCCDPTTRKHASAAENWNEKWFLQEKRRVQERMHTMMHTQTRTTRNWWN